MSTKLLLMSFGLVVTTAVVSVDQLPGTPSALRLPVPACLHDADERPADAQRRESALELARAIIRVEDEIFQRTGRYELLEALKLPPTPSNFSVTLVTDGNNYIFSIKDRRDTCRFGIFSDQEGIIYQSSPRAVQVAQTQ